MAFLEFSEPSVRRLSLYYRALLNAKNERLDYFSSAEIGLWAGVTADQVRQDFKRFIVSGRQKKGYPVNGAIERIKEILGHNRNWSVILIGIGNLGQALLDYHGFWKHGFQIIAGFDIDPIKIKSAERGVRIHHLDELESFVESNRVDIGVIAVPGSAAQNIGDRMVEVGIDAILNFTPRRILVPAGTHLRNVDITFALETLSFMVTNAPD